MFHSTTAAPKEAAVLFVKKFLLQGAPLQSRPRDKSVGDFYFSMLVKNRFLRLALKRWFESGASSVIFYRLATWRLLKTAACVYSEVLKCSSSFFFTRWIALSTLFVDFCSASAIC